MKTPKYIIRVKDAWRVRIRQNYKVICNKQISFKKHGGIKKSLEYAVQYRDRILKEHNLFERLNYKKSPDYFKNKKKGCCAGIYFYSHIQREKLVTYWVANYSIKGKHCKKYFSINKYGYEEAFIKACEVRYEKCGTLHVMNEKTLPCEPTVPFIIH